MLSITNKDIDYAVDKVITFAKINRSRAPKEKIESLNLLATAVGLEGMKFDYLMSAVKKYYDDEGSIMLGILLGLFLVERKA